MQRLQVRFEGRVQGVGFRMTVADLARSFQITGKVCNVSDGSVELVAEGESAELVDFLQAILQRLARYVVQHQAVWEEATTAAKWPDFAIAPDKLA